MRVPDRKKAFDSLNDRLQKIEKENEEYWNSIQRFNINLGRRAYEHEHPQNKDKLSFIIEDLRTGIENWDDYRKQLIESARIDEKVQKIGIDPEEYTNLVIKFCKLVYVVDRLKLESFKLQSNTDYSYNIEEEDGTITSVTIRFTEDELIKLTKVKNEKSTSNTSKT